MHDGFELLLREQPELDEVVAQTAAVGTLMFGRLFDAFEGDDAARYENFAESHDECPIPRKIVTPTLS